MLESHYVKILIIQIFKIFTAESNPVLTKNTRLKKFFNKFLEIKKWHLAIIICVPETCSKSHFNQFNP